MEQGMGWFFYVVVMAIFWVIVKKASKRHPTENSKGQKVLILPSLFGLIGIFSAMAGTSVIIYGLIDFDGENIIPQFLIFILFTTLGMLLVLEKWISKIILTKKSIVKINMFGKRKEIKWKDITDVTFSSGTLELKIRNDETKINCHKHLIGFDHIVDQLEKNTEFHREQLKIPNI